MILHPGGSVAVVELVARVAVVALVADTFRVWRQLRLFPVLQLLRVTPAHLFTPLLRVPLGLPRGPVGRRIPAIVPAVARARVDTRGNSTTLRTLRKAARSTSDYVPPDQKSRHGS